MNYIQKVGFLDVLGIDLNLLPLKHLPFSSIGAELGQGCALLKIPHPPKQK